MRIKKLPDGTLLVPKRIEADGVVGDGMVEVKVEDPEYQKYLAAYEREQTLS